MGFFLVYSLGVENRKKRNETSLKTYLRYSNSILVASTKKESLKLAEYELRKSWVTKVHILEPSMSDQIEYTVTRDYKIEEKK